VVRDVAAWAGRAKVDSKAADSRAWRSMGKAPSGIGKRAIIDVMVLV
jgi:hypothetical protein